MCGEGDITFRELLRAWEAGREPGGVAGLSYRTAAGFVRTPPRPASRLGADEVRLPRRSARALDGYTFLGRQIDVVETSRGCTFDCSFCSIIEMRGRNFYKWTIERVIADIIDARRRGARAIFLVDDNITLDVHRFESLCRAIVDAGLHDIDYIVQAMTSSIAAAGETLAPLMRAAGFRYVFLGIENVLDADLGFLRARAKNARRGAPAGGQRDPGGDRCPAPPRHVRGRRADRRQPVGHPGIDRGQPRLSPASTSTGPTFNTRHRIRARR